MNCQKFLHRVGHEGWWHVCCSSAAVYGLRMPAILWTNCSGASTALAHPSNIRSRRRSWRWEFHWKQRRRLFAPSKVQSSWHVQNQEKSPSHVMSAWSPAPSSIAAVRASNQGVGKNKGNQNESKIYEDQPDKGAWDEPEIHHPCKKKLTPGTRFWIHASTENQFAWSDPWRDAAQMNEFAEHMVFWMRRPTNARTICRDC